MVPNLPSAAMLSQTGPAFSLGRSRQSPRSRTLTCAAALSAVTEGLHLHDPRKYIDYYSFTDPRGMEG